MTETEHATPIVGDLPAFLALSRSAAQLTALNALAHGEAIHRFAYAPQGRATRHSYSYAQSFAGMLERIHAAGYRVVFTPGPRGGQRSATYRLASEGSDDNRE